MGARDDGNAPAYAAAGGMAGVAIMALFAIVAVILGTWIALYPIQSLVTIGSWLLASELSRPLATGLTDFNYYLVRFGLPAMIGIATAVYTARVDQRLGENVVYHTVRHVIRLAVIAVGTMLAHASIQFGVVCSKVACLVEANRVSKGIPLILACLAVVIAHFVLRSRYRDEWHESMERLKLRPADAGTGRTRPLTVLSAIVLPLGIAGGLAMRPPTLPWDSGTPMASRPVPARVDRKPSASEASVLASVMGEALRITPPPTVAYGSVRQALVANGASITDDRFFMRDRSGRILSTTGPGGYGRARVHHVQYMFDHDVLVSISVAVAGPHPPGTFDSRLASLRQRYSLTKRDGEWAMLTGKHQRLTVRTTDGLLIEYYEFVGTFAP